MAFPLIYFLPAATVTAGNLLYKKAEKFYAARAKEESTPEDHHSVLSLKIKAKIYSLLIGKDDEESTGAVYADKMKEYRRTDGSRLNRDIAITLVSMGFAVGAMIYPFFGILSAIGILYTTVPVYVQAYRMLKAGRLGVDLLSSLAILGCVLSGYFFTAALVNLIFFFSLKLLVKVSDDSIGKLTDVFGQIPNFVWIRTDEDTELRIPFQDVKEDDLVVVSAGETVPVDGTITEGMASIDQHVLTGEMVAAEKIAGEKVFALTTVISGKVTVRVERAGKDTVVSRIGDILDHTVDFQSKTELRALMLADRTVPPTVAVSGAALLFMGPHTAIGVLAAHFKYNFMLVSPVSIMNFLKIASENGVLIKDGRSLDLLPRVDTIVFDKTGTLTEEQPIVDRIICCGKYTEQEVLLHAAAAESKQTHPVAMAILKEAEDRGLKIPLFNESDYRAGYGISVDFAGRKIHVGSLRFMVSCAIKIPRNILEMETSCHDKGHSLVITAIDHHVAGAIELIPALRPETAEMIRRLQALPQIKELYIISGDHEAPTQFLAHQLGIDHYFAEILPEDKAEIITALRDKGKFVCYVGDGINDALAMKNSNLSVSLRGASSIATDTARIVLMDQGIGQLPFLFDLARDFQRNSNLMFGLTAAPSVIGTGGVLLFGLGITGATLLGQTGLMAAAGVAMMPSLKNAKTKNKCNKITS